MSHLHHVISAQDRTARQVRHLTPLDEQLLRAASRHEVLKPAEIIRRAGLVDSPHLRRRLYELARHGRLTRVPYRRGYRLARCAI